MLAGEAFGSAALTGTTNESRRRQETLVSVESTQVVYVGQLLRTDYNGIVNGIEKHVYRTLGNDSDDRKAKILRLKNCDFGVTRYTFEGEDTGTVTSAL